jgi:hypothetical protein
MKLKIPLRSTTILLPGIVLILSLAYLNHGPYFLSFNSDPEYAYLFNSLNILRGAAPTHIDHPGTPLQILGAIVLFSRGIIVNSSVTTATIQKSVLQNPEGYLNSISLVIQLLLFFMISYSGWKFSRATGTILPSLTMQGSLLCYYTALLAFGRVSPEPLLIFSAFFLGISLTTELVGQENGCPKPAWSGVGPLSAGCALGLGMALKITFLPLIFFVLFFDSFKKKCLAVASSALFFVICTLPILSKYAVLFNWFRSIATHDGMYGHGHLGIPSIWKLLTNLQALFFREPLLFLLLVIYFSLALFLKKKNGNSHRGINKKVKNLLWIGCLIIASQVVITAKHPSVHYMLPAMAATCFINAAIVYVMFKDSDKLSKRIGVIFLFFLCVSFIFNGVRIKEWVLENHRNVYKSEELISKVNSIKNSLKIGVYRSSLPGFALSFGNDWSGNSYGKPLAQLYPDTIFYNIWDQTFYSFTGRLSPEAMETLFKKYQNIVMVGSIRSISNDKKLKVQPVYSNQIEGIYRMQK